jgi:phage terminase large subunit-like protein
MYNKRPPHKKKKKGENLAEGTGNLHIPTQTPTSGTSKVVQTQATGAQPNHSWLAIESNVLMLGI